MTRRIPLHNVQSGAPLPPAADPDPQRVARGERTEGVWLERDPDQVVRARHTAPPARDLPPDIPSSREDEARRTTSPGVTDLNETPYGPSVWEALPEDLPPEPAPPHASAEPQSAATAVRHARFSGEGGPMPIHNDQEYEAALEEAVARMEAHPDRAVEDPRLMALLADIEAWRPTFDMPQPPPRDEISERARELVARACEVKRQFEERRTRWTNLPKDGRGIGPTTGV